jgi:hypothetical protein
VKEIHDALIALRQVREWRAHVDFESEGAVMFQQVLIVCDEMGIMSAALRAYWEEIRPKGSPKTSPALVALADIAMAGRSASMHLMMAAQHFTARVSGAGDNTVKENASTRILASTPAAWRLLGHGHQPEQRSRVPGRMHLVTPERVIEMQVPYLRPAEAVEWATGAGSLAGVLPPGVVPFAWEVADPGFTPSLVPGQGGAPVIESTEPRRTLPDWLAAGDIAGRPDTWRKRRRTAVAAGTWTDTPDRRYTLAQVRALSDRSDRR